MFKSKSMNTHKSQFKKKIIFKKFFYLTFKVRNWFELKSNLNSKNETKWLLKPDKYKCIILNSLEGLK
jgi:hypothetical protein